MLGEDIPIRAEVASLSGLSAHGDANDLVRWARTMARPPRQVYLVHGETDAAQALATRLRTELGWTVEIPGRGDSVTL